MTKEYRDYLKEYDPIHYAEMMGDPVTGLGTNLSLSFWFYLFVVLIIGIGVVIGLILSKII
ncbi:hypothetical protein MHM83_10990 [Tenacibaculum sp. Mcav3-52]|uniref:hypothetical protein n=1 Tax=Tenacibaculum sp. Mcav3-52 TaxID=2917762 RepID=UPI001EF21315|nr:hypothetical protein [Tenacibaculum sp. Mcav3-52]MCG7502398.1 hypothetical protein [Tenacibaculum sp. Mcav3-52]